MKTEMMTAARIGKYSRRMEGVSLQQVPRPEPQENELLVKVRAAAVNPLDILQITGQVRLLHPYAMPLTLGNECAGIVEKVGRRVTDFQVGDRVYARLPVDRIGAFAEYVAADQGAWARMPAGYDFVTAAAIPLAGLTAWQGLVEELEVQAGGRLLITGASGSFGQVAVPIARALGLRVVVTGNARARERFEAMGVEQYIDYRQANYWDLLSGVDYVIDTLGAGEFEHGLSVLRPGGRLLSLRLGPNRAFAERQGMPWLKRELFALAGHKYDAAARRQGKEYRFLFVRSNGEQLRRVTEIVEQRGILPDIDSHTFSLEQIREALALVAKGPVSGKVVIPM